MTLLLRAELLEWIERRIKRDGGSTEHESLEILLWQVVDKILEGGK